ncbi:hypothetical protein A9Q99_22365 [Gammaproteobacteria bacterium 45_16_T64]|nr:hypothetical protein A9Q99_22365 [Gammaproteobacteria bacterium 45_16_T64]
MAKNTSFLTNAKNFVRHAVERRTRPERFILSDKTPNDVIYSEGIMKLRYYPHTDTEAFELDDEQVTPTTARHKVPVLLVPPLGVFGWIYDLMAERSWVRFLNARGFEVYLLDWGSPTKENSDLCLETYVNQWYTKAVEEVHNHSGSDKISLVGYCMGGLLTLLYAGAHGHGNIQNIVTIASPIDFHKNHIQGKFLKALDKVTKHIPLSSLEVNPSKFHVPGDMVSVAFKLTNPLAGVFSYFDLVRNLSDREYIQAHLTTKEWFTNMADYPGATVQQLGLKFSLRNQLASGIIPLTDHEADFSRIDANYLGFAGTTDNIVSIPAAKKIIDLISSKDKSFEVVPGGHAGVFAGGKAKLHTWAMTADWLAERSA